MIVDEIGTRLLKHATEAARRARIPPRAHESDRSRLEPRRPQPRLERPIAPHRRGALHAGALQGGKETLQVVRPASAGSGGHDVEHATAPLGTIHRATIQCRDGPCHAARRKDGTREPPPARSPSSMRVALAHHWLSRPRGGERVLADLARIFPEAPIFTSLYDRRADWPSDQAALAPRIRTTALQPLYALDARHEGREEGKEPRAFRTFGNELRCYDVLLVSDAGLAKCIPAPEGTRKLVYLHTPMRRVWLHVPGIGREFPGPLRPLARAAVRRLRAVDRAAARTVHAWAANSRTTRDRMAAIYGLDPASIPVVHPAPPALESGRPLDDAAGSKPALDGGARAGFLVVSPLARYKRDDLAILAATRLGAPLTVVGDGPERARLERLAGPSVAFLGHVPDRDLARLYRRAAGLVFCAEEDFGLVPVEAMREGCPVLAFRAGGATETVQEGTGGLFFDEPSVESVTAGLTRLAARGWDPVSVRASVARFSMEAFEREIRDWVEGTRSCGRRDQLFPASRRR